MKLDIFPNRVKKRDLIASCICNKMYKKIFLNTKKASVFRRRHDMQNEFIFLKVFNQINLNLLRSLEKKILKLQMMKRIMFLIRNLYKKI